MSAHKHTHTTHPFADRTPVVPLLAALACLGALMFLYKNNVSGVFDIDIYKGIGERLASILQGGTATLDSEYPPLATLLFFLASANVVHFGFGAAWLSIVFLGIAVSGVYAVFVLRDRLGWLVPATIAGTVFLIGPELVFARFDVLVVVMLLLSLRARATNHFAQSAAFLAVACALKVVPVLLIPALFCTAPRAQWKRMIAGFAVGLGVSFAVPVAVMGLRLTVENIRHMLEYHANREVQIESTWSSIDMLLKALVGQRVPVSMGHLSVNNNDLGSSVLSVAKLLIVGTSIAASALALVRRRSQSHVDTLLVGLLLFAVAASPVFSPQYVVWLLPLLLLWLAVRAHALCDRGMFWTVAGLTALIGFSTQWVFPLNYMDVIDQYPMALFMLNVRNIAVLLLAIAMLRYALFAPRHTLHRRSELKGGLCRLAMDCALLLFAVGLLQAFRADFLPHVSDARYRMNDGLHGSASGTPFSLPSSTEDVTVTMVMQFPSTLANASFLLKPDDCITSLSLNGNDIPAAVFCGDPHVVDFSSYLRDGNNVLVASLRNTGGPVGLIVSPARLALLPFILSASVVLTLGMTLLGIWNVVGLALALRHSFLHPAAVRSVTRRKAEYLLTLPLLESAAAA